MIESDGRDRKNTENRSECRRTAAAAVAVALGVKLAVDALPDAAVAFLTN